MTNFTDAERADFVPPDCPNCGSDDVDAAWSRAAPSHDERDRLNMLVGLRCADCGCTWTPGS